VVFLQQNWINLQISFILSFVYVIDMIRDSNMMKYNFFFFLRCRRYKEKKMNDANIEKLKGILKKQK
jgi:hypothetical protein